MNTESFPFDETKMKNVLPDAAMGDAEQRREKRTGRDPSLVGI